MHEISFVNFVTITFTLPLGWKEARKEKKAKRWQWWGKKIAMFYIGKRSINRLVYYTWKPGKHLLV